MGKRWFDRKNSNTYNSVIISVDGIEHKLGAQYGSDDQYLYRSLGYLLETGLIEEKYRSLRVYCSRNNITFNDFVADVGRKKDLD